MLTQVAVQAAKPREIAYKLSDGNGLHLLSEAGGSKLWRFAQLGQERYDALQKRAYSIVKRADAIRAFMQFYVSLQPQWDEQ